MCFVACPRACVHDGLRQPQDEILTVIRRVDDNWAEGMLGDKIGIFPLLYVEVRSCSQTRFLFRSADCFTGQGREQGWAPGLGACLPRQGDGDCVGFLFRLLCYENCLSSSNRLSQAWLWTILLCGSEGGPRCRLSPLLSEILHGHPLSQTLLGVTALVSPAPEEKAVFPVSLQTELKLAGLAVHLQSS